MKNRKIMHTVWLYFNTQMATTALNSIMDLRAYLIYHGTYYTSISKYLCVFPFLILDYEFLKNRDK